MNERQSAKAEMLGKALMCINTVSEKIDHETALYVKYRGNSGLCCGLCCKMANAFYSSPEYKNFELAEEDAI